MGGEEGGKGRAIGELCWPGACTHTHTHTQTQVEIGDGAASRLVFSVYGPTWRPHMPIVPIVFENATSSSPSFASSSR